MAYLVSGSITTWRVHMMAPRTLLYDLLTPDDDPAQYWANAPTQLDSEGGWIVPEGAHLKDAALDLTPPGRIAARYGGGSVTTLDLFDDGRGGTDLRLTDIGQPAEDRTEVVAGGSRCCWR